MKSVIIKYIRIKNRNLGKYGVNPNYQTKNSLIIWVHFMPNFLKNQSKDNSQPKRKNKSIIGALLVCSIKRLSMIK